MIYRLTLSTGMIVDALEVFDNIYDFYGSHATSSEKPKAKTIFRISVKDTTKSILIDDWANAVVNIQRINKDEPDPKYVYTHVQSGLI